MFRRDTVKKLRWICIWV